jgi:Zn-dependent protease with chaperone function
VAVPVEAVTPVLFLLPVALWAASGLGLIIAIRRSTSRLVLRLAATFAGLWAFLATTALVAIVMMGGWPAFALLERNPLSLLSPGHEIFLWLGAAGALLLFTVAFSLNQLVGWGLRSLLRPTPLPWPAGWERPEAAMSLYRFSSPHPDAFSFTLLEPRIARLSPEEVNAVVAHELGHVRDLDSRYLTFVRTFARMMRWDPVLAYLASSLTRHEEYRADDAAAWLTGDPRALARALYKVLESPGPVPVRPWVTALLAPRGRRGRREALVRIERLLTLAETLEHGEGRRA